MPDSDIANVNRITDPSQLTTRQILREVSLLEEKFAVRFTAGEKAVDNLFSKIDNMPAVIDHALEHINAVHAEKFNSIQTQFRERDTRSEQGSKDSKTAVDAALQAAKEAVGEQNKSSALAITKSETATAKQLDQVSALIQASNKATDEKINDIKSRLDLTTGQAVGVHSGKDDTKSWIAIAVSITVLLVMIISEIAQRMK